MPHNDDKTFLLNIWSRMHGKIFLIICYDDILIWSILFIQLVERLTFLSDKKREQKSISMKFYFSSFFSIVLPFSFFFIFFFASRIVGSKKMVKYLIINPFFHQQKELLKLSIFFLLLVLCSHCRPWEW